MRPADRVALGDLEAAPVLARETGESRPALVIVAGALVDMGVRAVCSTRSARLIPRDRDAWLWRLRSAGRSMSSIGAYRGAIDDLLSWAERRDRTGELFEEQAIVDYLDESEELHAAAEALSERSRPGDTCEHPRRLVENVVAARNAAGDPLRAPAPTDPIEIGPTRSAAFSVTRTRRLDP